MPVRNIQLSHNRYKENESTHTIVLSPIAGSLRAGSYPRRFQSWLRTLLPAAVQIPTGIQRQVRSFFTEKPAELRLYLFKVDRGLP